MSNSASQLFSLARNMLLRSQRALVRYFTANDMVIVGPTTDRRTHGRTECLKGPIFVVYDDYFQRKQRVYACGRLITALLRMTTHVRGKS